MDAYDWDKTVFRYDTTGRFFVYCCRRYPAVRRYLGVALKIALRHISGKAPIPAMKQEFYRYLTCLPDVEAAVRDFWARNSPLIGSPAMPCSPKPGDVILSASGEFLLRDVCRERGLVLIGSLIDPATGTQTGHDCYGEEKVRRFRERFGEDVRLERWYSDSLSDTPMARLARRPFLVSPKGIKPWPDDALR